MKANKIHVSYFNYVAITELTIDQKVGEHAEARIRGNIQDKDVEEYKRLLTEKIWVTISGQDENGENRILMTGIIAGFSLECLQHIYTLELRIKSGTYLMDGRKHFRSFQNQSATYLDVMELIRPMGRQALWRKPMCAPRWTFCYSTGRQTGNLSSVWPVGLD